MRTAKDVLEGRKTWAVECFDRLDFLRSLPRGSVDLVLGSPPYEAARTYGVGFKLKGQDWVDWMVATFKAALRASKGLVAFVLEGQTRGYRWSAVPALLMADLHRAGIHLRRPAIFHRVGIPGSGGPDWLRADTEFVVCASQPGRLPWSDNTACGHPPKWAPGGDMSHRLSNGARVNQWGHPIGSGATTVDKEGVVRSKGKRPSHREVPHKFMSMTSRGANGERKIAGGRAHTKAKADGDEDQLYLPPAIANPGNLPQRTYTADEVAALLAEAADVVHCKVGGGMMGHDLSHENEAPYPLELASFFVKSFCPPGGIVCDCFSGSGTTLHAALLHGRRFVGCDVRSSQVELTQRRAQSVKMGLGFGNTAIK